MPRRKKIGKNQLIRSILDLWVKNKFIEGSDKDRYIYPLSLSNNEILLIILTQMAQLDLIKTRYKILDEIYEENVKNFLIDLNPRRLR